MSNLLLPHQLVYFLSPPPRDRQRMSKTKQNKAKPNQTKEQQQKTRHAILFDSRCHHATHIKVLNFYDMAHVTVATEPCTLLTVFYIWPRSQELKQFVWFFFPFCFWFCGSPLLRFLSMTIISEGKFRWLIHVMGYAQVWVPANRRLGLQKSFL